MRHVRKTRMRDLVCSRCGRKARHPMAQAWKHLTCGLTCPGPFVQGKPAQVPS